MKIVLDVFNMFFWHFANDANDIYIYKEEEGWRTTAIFQLPNDYRSSFYKNTKKVHQGMPS